MGPSQSKQITIKIPHQRFLKCHFLNNSNAIQSQIPVDFKKYDFQYWKTMLQQIKQDPNCNYLFLPESYEQQMPSFTCNVHPTLKLTFPLFPYLLEQQIKNRSIGLQKNYFDQQELWMLLYSLVKSQRAFSNLSLKVGDIHPHNIFVNQEGYPRLACQFSWPNQKTNFQKMYYQKSFRYLSPQQMKLCEMGQNPDLCSTTTSQAFSIGLTILSAGILQSLQQICDLKSFKFNQKYLIDCLNHWDNLKFKKEGTNQFVSYSSEIKEIIKALCRVKPEQRQLPSKIYQILKPYQQKIMAIQHFNFDKSALPAKKQNKNQCVTIYYQNPLNINQSNNQANYHHNNNSQNNLITKPLQNNQYHKDLFNHYAALSSRQKQKEQTKISNLQQIKKDLKLQFTESVHRQNMIFNDQNLNLKKQSQFSIYQYGNYQSIIDAGSLQSSNYKNNLSSNHLNDKNSLSGQHLNYMNGLNTQHVKFTSNYYQPPKIIRNQQNIKKYTQSVYVKQTNNPTQLGSINEPSFEARKLDVQFLQKLQRQIQQSKRSFPETNKNSNQNISEQKRAQPKN